MIYNLIKGKICTSDFDCPSTDPLRFTACKCGHNDKGNKYCDIEGGDDEWAEAFTNVRRCLMIMVWSISNIS